MVSDFIKSLLFPTKMVRFRYMSVIFALGIFVLSSYLLMVPAKVEIENSFGEKVQEDNFLYLQSITNIPSVNEESIKVFKELYDKKLTIDKDTSKLIGENMGCVKANIDESILGVLTVNKDGNWVYNGTDTQVKDNKPENTKHNVKIENGKLYIDNVETIVSESSDLELELVTLSLTKKGYFIINNQTTKINSVKDSVDVSKNQEGFITLNGHVTNIKIENKNVIISFTERTDINYYENSFTYINDEGINVNIKVVIDLFDSDPNFVPSEDFAFIEGDDQIGGRFENIRTTEYVLILFRSDYVYYQANPINVEELEIERYGSNITPIYVNSFYSSVNVDYTMFETVDESVDTLSEIIRVGYIANYNSVYSIITFVYCIGFTLLFAFIFWIFFRKTGRLKRFKEYYNIASIVAVPITILTFIILWFYPGGIGNVFPFVFVVYYLFVLYRINSTPEIV